MMKELDHLKKQILELHKEWDAISGDVEYMNEFESVEYEVQQLIVKYCERQGYDIDGFPFETRKQLTEDEADEYFTYERYEQYLEKLALSHDDVAKLLWFYYHTFWPDVDLWPDKGGVLTFIRNNQD